MFKIFKSYKQMDENEFWNIISMFDWIYEGDDNMVMLKATNYLSKRSNEDITKFQKILSKLLYDIDGIEYAKNIGQDSYKDDVSYFSVDSFLYSRCCVLANGREFYYKVLNVPTNMPKDVEFESILYLANDAYLKKNNEELDILTEYSFETFSNKGNWRDQYGSKKILQQ